MTALGFGAPAVLWALLLLPVLWWLLRATPPKPADVTFAPTRLLLGIVKREETPTRTPWWLMAIRLALAALVILALSQPILRPDALPVAGAGPALIVIDNTFGAAVDWEARIAAATRLVDEAEGADRTVIIAGSAEAAEPLTPISAAEAREKLALLRAEPWAARRADLAAQLQGLTVGSAAWLTDGLGSDGPRSDGPGSNGLGSDGPGSDVLGSDGLGSDDDATLYAALDAASEGPVRVYLPDRGAVVGVATVAATEAGMDVTLVADANPGPLPRTVRVVDQRGFVLAEAPAAFDGTGATAQLTLPTELRNEAARVTVEGERTAAAVRLLDERFRRRTVGLISGGSAEQDQPLLSPLHFLRAALAPSSDLREPIARDLPGAIDELVDAGTSVIILADVGTLLPGTQDTLARWINAGGVLLRFAGSRTADGMDDLVPVEMRVGARTLGGSLSWEQPQPLSEYARTGPFAGLTVPGDVVVQRQLLAEPSMELTERTWAALADGTPFVTGRGVGAGWVAFFHVTADPSWSTLPLSGSFVEMLRRVVELSAAGPSSDAAGGPSLPPYRVLDGAGRLVTPGPDVVPISGEVVPGPRTPPGLYGADGAFRAINLFDDGATLSALDPQAFAGASVTAYATEGPTELKGPLMTAAAVLLLADALAILLLMGAFRRRVVAGIAITLLSLGLAPEVRAQDAVAGVTGAARDFAMRASLETRLAFIATGNAEIDRLSEAGLRGLSLALTQRTAVEPAEPMGINLENDELSFFPLIYWPIAPDAARPSERAIAKVDAFMKNGGTILFDTRDQAGAGVMAAATPATLALRRILDGLDIPELEPVPDDHVLTKTFYLLQGFPGRWSGSPLWVEVLAGAAEDNRPARAGDGVSPILITANDLAGAWAIGSNGTFLLPTVPNDPYQRELAYRAGINIAIYTMTGNYKADQVHVPALLERLGQ